jgi:endo-1,4-beta-D-glucanase Y
MHHSGFLRPIWTHIIALGGPISELSRKRASLEERKQSVMNSKKLSTQIRLTPTFGQAEKKKASWISLTGLMLVSAVTQTLGVEPWNLPYARPAAYDYSPKYAANMQTYVKAVPGYFRDEMGKGWKFYKENFIQSNGLVNHRRLEGGPLIGQNEAVSEGQGYGMILAVLMNDQATFNRIFEAANSQMWDAGRKSLYKWRLPAGDQGAATVGDLDYALALVYADELQKAKFWDAYNKGGVTYGGRALESIKSIRQNMTASDHLLPGDNWGGDGVNNLNPSYFATAWMKVFNAYQKEVDFTPVINNAYTVLAKTPRYAQGQAPDWCNPSGQQSSQGGGKEYRGMGMLSDAIRTPYRIAADALWFNDSRAKAYCKNTIKTLTEYANANSRLLAAQMALYTDAGVAITDSKGAFDNVAMWSCAVLGADDVAYSGKALTSVLFSIITGTNLDFFGDSALQDHQFYYKQSLGLLGFALIGGQFPNLFADEKKAPVSLGDSRISARAQAMKNQSGLAFSIDALGRLQTTTAQTGKLVRSLP